MPRKDSKGKNITNADHEPVQDTVIEETLPIESKEEIAQQVVESPALIPIPEVQSDTSPKRQKDPVEEIKEHEPGSVLDAPTKKSQKDKEKRRSLQTAVSEDTPMEEPNLPRENDVCEESESQASENDEPVVENANEPLEIPREHVLEDVQTPQASVGHNSEPIDQGHGESGESHGETAKEGIFAPQPQPEHISLSAPVHHFEDIPVSTTIFSKASLPNEPVSDETTKTIEDIEPIMVYESNLPEDVVPEDIIAPVEYVEPDSSLQETLPPRDSLSKRSDKNIEVSKPNTIDVIPLQEDVTAEEDPRKVEFDEPSQSFEEFLLPRELALEEASKDFDQSLPKEAAIQDESRNVEIYGPSHILEESSLSTEPATNIQKAEPLSSELPVFEESDARDASTTKKTKNSKKNKSKDDFQPEPATPTEIIQEPEPTLIAQEAVSEKPFEITESNDLEILEEPIEKGIETVEPESYHFLDPTSVPLPEDLVDESIELDEPANAEILEKPLEHSTSTPRESFEFSEPVSPITENSVQEPAPVSPTRSRKDKKKRKPVMAVSLAKESPSSESISKIDARAVEPKSEEAPQIPAVPAAGPSGGNNRQRATKLATTSRNIEAVELIPQDNFADPIGRISPKQLKKDKKRKSRLSMSSAEENTTRAPLEPPAAQQAEDKTISS
ncbi:hypothetical protein DID88_003867 [Monilinia fructigena]|uniref:Uncharacterized protein n=1 Tax=Monilinia fructigena TaxID=38457 RepID=A0A395IT11_9HELO|nr:hypothetical protein DID88_003867 [Monilinia fructigena]